MILIGEFQADFASMSLQTGGATFSAGDQSTNLPISNSNILWGAAAALLGATLAEWQKKREEEAARLAAMRNSGGGGGEEDNDAADKKRMKALAKANPAYARSLAQQQSVKAAIAKVTAQEQKTWTRENTQKVEATQAYKESDNKGQYLKQALQGIRVEEAEYRAEQAEREQTMQSHRQGEKDAVAIVADYEARMQEQAMFAHRAGEWNAVAIAEEYKTRVREEANSSYHEGERNAVEIAEEYEIRTQQSKVADWLSSASSSIGSAINNLWQASPLQSFWNENANKRILPGLTPKNIATIALSLTLGYNGVQWANNIALNPHIFDGATKNFIVNLRQLEEEYPHTGENSKFSYLISNPFDALSTGYDVTKALFNSAAGYADAIWQENPAVQTFVDAAESIGDHCPTALGEAWDRRCSAIPYFLAGVMENPADTTVGVVTSLVADPVVGFIKMAAYGYENNNPYQLTADTYESVQKDGLIDGVVNVIADRINGAGDLLSDPQVQAFGIITLFVLATALGLGVPALLVGGGMVLSQTFSLLTQIDKAIQAAPTREEAMKVVTNSQTRRQIATTIVLLGLLILGAKNELDAYNKVTAFRENLSPSAQTLLWERAYSEQVRIFNAAEELKVSPQALDFYLTESARPNSVLADLPLTDALRVSPILQDYVARYGYTEALRMAPPEVIRGLENSQFIVQAQEILSKDAGYNITQEVVFTEYPGSTIGKNVTFITNEASIRNIIGDFQGMKTIYITLDKAYALEIALGLKPRGSLANGFRISKISNLDVLDISYPLDGNTLFRGPGKGLPGGGTEMIINPPVSMNSPNVIDQIIIKVIP